MSFRLIESSGLSLLANLKELEVFKAAHNSLNTSEESLIFFFKSMKKKLITPFTLICFFFLFSINIASSQNAQNESIEQVNYTDY